jgi:DNA-binding IclR family transcriptional regulator
MPEARANPLKTDSRPPQRGGRRTGTQSIQRAALLVRLIAARSGPGSRLAEIVQHSQLERSTVRRMLRCLIEEGFVRQDADTRRYALGPLVFELGLAAAPQFNLVDICRPALARLAEATGDTVFLAVRSGYDTVCIDRREGSFPIRALTLDVGTRRPLGAGAGGLALLMPLSDAEVNTIVNANAVRLRGYNFLTVPALNGMLKRARELGYALNDNHITAGATSISLPIISRYGQPFAAISVGAISSRMDAGRQKKVAAMLRKEVKIVESALNEAART